MGHFYAIASSASIVQNEDISRVHTETTPKMMEEIAGNADRRGSDGAGVDEKHGHHAAVWQDVEKVRQRRSRIA
jgi:hypothetical protein